MPPAAPASACIGRTTARAADPGQALTPRIALSAPPTAAAVRSLHVGATAIVRLPPVPISAGMPLESLVLAGCTNLHLSSFDVTLLTAMPKLASLVSVGGRARVAAAACAL